MGVMKEGINHICKRLDDIRTLLMKIAETESDKRQVLEGLRRELVTQNNVLCDFGEMLEEVKAGEPPKDLTVQPVERSNGEKLFLVTGEELCNLLEACRGAKIRMKEN